MGHGTSRLYTFLFFFFLYLRHVYTEQNKENKKTEVTKHKQTKTNHIEKSWVFREKRSILNEGHFGNNHHRYLQRKGKSATSYQNVYMAINIWHLFYKMGEILYILKCSPLALEEDG